MADCETPAADVYIVAVPTPVGAGTTPDLTAVRTAVRSIAPRLRGGELVILESTVPPGTTRRTAEWILAARPDLSLDGADGRPVVHVAHCPERVLPGRTVVELIENDRTVGGLTEAAAERARDLYALFCTGQILTTDATTAEMVKLVENSFRDVNIAFANELSVICDTVGVDVWDVIELANHHPRVDILRPGPGVGGHCIAIDPWFLVAADPQHAQLIRQARVINAGRPARVARTVRRAVADVHAPVIAVLGLAFKPDIDDLRESPAVDIVEDVALALPAAQLLVVEPHVTHLPPELEVLTNVLLTDAEKAVADADLVVHLVDHTAFGDLDPALLAGTPVLSACRRPPTTGPVQPAAGGHGTDPDRTTPGASA